MNVQGQPQNNTGFNQNQMFIQNNNLNPNMMNMNGINNGMNFDMAQMMTQLLAMQQQLQQQQQSNQNQELEQKKKEMKKQQAKQMGKILKGQKELMEEIKRNEMIRKNHRMNRNITLFFKFIRSEYDFDLLPIEFKATTKLKDALEKYKNDSNNQNVRFMLNEEVLEPNDERTLVEIEEINDGEEIRVKPSS